MPRNWEKRFASVNHCVNARSGFETTSKKKGNKAVFNKKKKENAGLELPELKKQLRQIEENNSFYLNSIRALLILFKRFPLELKEIRTESFIEKIDTLIENLVEGQSRQTESLFEKSKKEILSFIDRHKTYLLEREKEFKEIIDMLTKAMADLGAENQNYNDKIYKQAENIEKLTLLDDIKAIKIAIKDEVSQIRNAVVEKQEEDNKKISELSSKVVTLESQLKIVESQSQKDGLTGLYNRLSFDSYINRLIDKSALSNSSFSLLMIDIDDFKPINDNFGHQVGDRVILAVVQKMLTYIRREDFSARYGGEEFVILLDGTSLKHAIKKGKQICKSLASTRYAVSDSNGKQITVTVSIGIASFQKGDTADMVINRADKALYKAKNTGKNKVVSEKEIR